MKPLNSTLYCLLAAAPLALTLAGCGETTSATPTSGRSSAEMISQGEKALAGGDFNEALSHFDDAVAKDPDSAQARERRAQAYLRLEKFEKAVDDCNAALKLNGKLTDAYMTRARAERNLNELTKALEDFSKAIDQSPERVDALTARGTLYQQMGESDPDGEHARKRLDDAAKDFDKALKINGRDAANLVRRAEIVLALGDHQAAIDDCSKALEIDPKFAAAHVVRARASIAKDDFDKAVEDCDAAIALDAKRPEAYVLRAKARVEKSSEAHTLEVIASLGKAADDCQTAADLAAKVKGDKDKLRRVRKWIAVVHELRGKLYEAAKAEKKAYDEYTAAVAIDPELAGALVGRGLVRAKSEDFAGALADCNAAIEIDNSRPEGYYGRGLVYRVQQKFTEAESSFNEALTRKYSKAYQGLTMTYAAMAVAEHAKVVALQKEPGGTNMPAYKKAAEEEYQMRQKCIESATKALEANRHLPAILLLRGLAYANSGRANLAGADFTAAIADDPKLAKAYYYRGVYYNNAGMLNEAIKDFTKAVDLQPNATMVYYRLEEDYNKIGDSVSAAAAHSKFIELTDKIKQGRANAVSSPEEMIGNAAKFMEPEAGAALQPLIKAQKELEKKLDDTPVKAII
jgi:tetratricopeptide (TPR) repeat protein